MVTWSLNNNNNNNMASDRLQAGKHLDPLDSYWLVDSDDDDNDDDDGCGVFGEEGQPTLADHRVFEPERAGNIHYSPP